MKPMDEYDLTLIQDNPNQSSWGDIRVQRRGDMFTFNISPSRKHPREGYGCGSMQSEANMARLFVFLADSLSVDLEALADCADDVGSSTTAEPVRCILKIAGKEKSA